MPRIITQGTNQLGRAAGTAAVLLREQTARQDQLKREAQDLALADREFEFRTQSADRNYELNQRSADRADKSFEITQKNAERQGAIFEQSMSQDDAARQYYAGVIEQDPNRTPQEIEYLRNADRGTLSQAANLSMYAKQIQEGGVQLETLAGTVAQAMQLQEGDPRVEVMKLMVEQGRGSLEGQAQVASMLKQELGNHFAHQAKIQQRATMAESFQPYAESLMATLPPSSAGLVGSAFTLYSSGTIDDEEFLGQLQDAVKNARSGTTNRTVGEEFLTSAARSFGTQLGSGGADQNEATKGLQSARDIASKLDGTKSAAKPNAQEAPASEEVDMTPYERDIEMAHKKITTRMGGSDANKKADFAMNLAIQMVEKQGLDPAENQDLIRQIVKEMFGSGAK